MQRIMIMHFIKLLLSGDQDEKICIYWSRKFPVLPETCKGYPPFPNRTVNRPDGYRHGKACGYQTAVDKIIAAEIIPRGFCHNGRGGGEGADGVLITISREG